MARATIIVAVDFPEEMQAAEEWFARWRDSLTYVSENEGCGCCVNIWNVEGPSEAFDALPGAIHGSSSWSESPAQQGGAADGPPKAFSRAEVGSRPAADLSR